MWVFVLLHGCSNSGLDRAEESADTGPTTGLADCPWVGEWALDDIRCGGTFTYSQWYESHEGATMVIDHDSAGGCTVVATVRGATCTRTEEWHFGVPAGNQVAYTSTGITDCSPNQCTFDADEAPCKRGELATPEAQVRVEELLGTMTAVNLLRNTISAEECTLDITTVWTK